MFSFERLITASFGFCVTASVAKFDSASPKSPNGKLSEQVLDPRGNQQNREIVAHNKSLDYYGSRYGATASTSEDIAATLSQEGFDVNVVNAKEDKLKIYRNTSLS